LITVEFSAQRSSSCDAVSSHALFASQRGSPAVAATIEGVVERKTTPPPLFITPARRRHRRTASVTTTVV